MLASSSKTTKLKNRQLVSSLEEAEKKLYDEREKTPEGKIENRKQKLEELQKQNTTLGGKFYGLGGILSKGAIARNTLAIANLEDQIYGSTEIHAREKAEIAQQKNWNNVLAKNSTRNNPANQH